MADLIALEHKTLKDSEGNPRIRLAPPKEADVLLRGDRGWKRAAKSKQPEATSATSPTGTSSGSSS